MYQQRVDTQSCGELPDLLTYVDLNSPLSLGFDQSSASTPDSDLFWTPGVPFHTPLFPTEVPSSAQAHQAPDARTQAQQTQDLLTQLAAEVAIDESWEQRGPGNLSTWLLPSHALPLLHILWGGDIRHRMVSTKELLFMSACTGSSIK